MRTIFAAMNTMYQPSNPPFLGSKEFFVGPKKFLTKQFVWPFVRTTNLLFLFKNLQGVILM